MPAIWMLAVALLVTGCAPSRVTAANADAVRRHADAAIRMAREEAESLRADLAQTRIAAAQQEAELQRLRQRVAQLQDERAARARAERERDRLAEDNRRLQAHAAELEHHRRAAAEGVAAQAKVRELESALQRLAAELAGTKWERWRVEGLTSTQADATPVSAPERHQDNNSAALRRDGDQGQARGSDARPRADSSEGANEAGGDRVKRVAVKPGDSLWAIAHQYGSNVQALKRANGLRTDRIFPGQELVIPR